MAQTKNVVDNHIKDMCNGDANLSLVVFTFESAENT